MTEEIVAKLLYDNPATATIVYCVTWMALIAGLYIVCKYILDIITILKDKKKEKIDNEHRD